MRASVGALVRRLAPFHVALKVAACLLLVSLWVEYDFMPRWWGPRALRDDMFSLPGSSVPCQFAVLPRKSDLPPGTPLVVIVGDSAVGGSANASETLPWMFREELRRRFPDRAPYVVNFGFIALYPQDAVFIVAKALSLDPDVVLYAVSPRVVLEAPVPRFTTKAYELAFQWDVLSRLGLPFTLSVVGRDHLGESVVGSWMPLVRYRLQLTLEAGRYVRPHLPRRALPLLDRLLPSPPARPQTAGPLRQTPYLWMREDHELDASHLTVRSLGKLIDVCGRAGRCVLYEIPVNPASRDGFEPGLVEEFDAWLEERSARAGVPVLEFRDRGRADQFGTNWSGKPDAIHPTKDGQAAFAAMLADALEPRLRDAAAP